MLLNPSQGSAMYSFCFKCSVTYLLIRPPLIITPCDSGPAVVASTKFLLPYSAVHARGYLISTTTAAVIPLCMASQIRVTETWLECIHDNRRFLIGSLLRNLPHGEELKKSNDLIAEEVIDQLMNMNMRGPTIPYEYSPV